MYSSAVRRAMAAMIRRLSGGLPLSQQGGQRPLLVALQVVELHAEAADGRDRAELDVGNAGYADGQLQGAVRQVNEQAAMVPTLAVKCPRGTNSAPPREMSCTSPWAGGWPGRCSSPASSTVTRGARRRSWELCKPAAAKRPPAS